MIELLAHLVGDYVLQSQPMSDRKVTDIRWALIHATAYTLPFLLLTQDVRRLAVIALTHALIDRYRIAARWVAWYGTGTRASGVWSRWNISTDAVPPFMSVWLTIIVDNTLHLVINHAALSVGP